MIAMSHLQLECLHFFMPGGSSRHRRARRHGRRRRRCRYYATLSGRDPERTRHWQMNKNLAFHK